MSEVLARAEKELGSLKPRAAEGAGGQHSKADSLVGRQK